MPSDIAQRLRTSFVAAYPAHVRRRLEELGVEPSSSLDEAIAQGTRWLDDRLGTLVGVPADQQRSSPLELVREAMRFPTEALQAAGVTPPPRDPAAVRALPGDRYDLAPASSQSLGAEAWEAHLAWGAAKAAAVTGGATPAPEPRRPMVGVLSGDLMDRSKIEPVVEAAGFELAVWRNPAAVAAAVDEGGTRPSLALVDLAHPSSDEAIRRLSAAKVHTVAYGPHVDDLAMARARSLGAADAVARSVFFRRLPDLLPRLT